MDVVGALTYFLSEAGRLKLDENIIIVAIVLWTVKSNFKKIENGLANLSNRIGDLATALMTVEQKHSERIGVLEKRMDKLDTKQKE